MYATFDIPALGNWLIRKEFSGPDAAAQANAEAGFRGRDGFSFIGPAPPYLRIETGEFGFHAIRFGRIVCAGHQYRLTGHEDWLVVCWPHSGTISATTRDGMVSARPGQCLIIPPGGRTVTSDGYFRSTRLMISTSALQAAFAGAGLPADVGLRCVCSLPYAPYVDLLYSVTRDLLRSFADRPDEVGTRPLAEAEAGIAGLVVSLLLEAEAVEGVSPDSSPALRIVRAAEALLRESVADEISIEQLCGRLNVGERSLQLAFEKVRGYSPRTYLKELRLEKARQSLISATADNAVTEAAMDAGFSHLGRFSDFYRRRYGESPSASLRRARVRH
jgi:AraC-like DNA-binding protein